MSIVIVCYTFLLLAIDFVAGVRACWSIMLWCGGIVRESGHGGRGGARVECTRVDVDAVSRCPIWPKG